MSAFQERIKVFRELPILKVQLEELKLKLESLEKIKNSVSSENYLSLSNSYVKQISELTHRIDELQAGIVVQKNEIELDSKVLESENSLVKKELQEMQFLFERGALSKQDYKVKRNALQQKINKNKSHLGKNQSCNKELDFYATYIGTDTYIKHIYKEQTGSFKLKFSNVKLKVWVSIGVIATFILAAIIFYNPVKAVIDEKIAWNKAIKENTYISYARFMSQFPIGKHNITAKAKQEDVLWLDVKKGKSLVLIDRYISLYPVGIYLNEANFFRDSLMWVDISKSNNLSAYAKYLSLFPKGKFVNQALAKITEISAASSFVDNRDGKVYKIVQIGNQVWMGENLAYKANSDSWAYDNDQSYVTTYGYLYNWETAKNICPSGWHLPTDGEWTILTDYLGGVSVAGGKLKESGTIHWKNPNEGATNESGFTALPGGQRISNGAFYHVGGYGYWWSSTESSTINAWSRGMGYYDNNVNRYFGKTEGFSVRCVKD